MRDKLLQIRVDEDFLLKLEYLRKINGFKTISETARKIIEKEFRKETEKMKDWTITDFWKFTSEHQDMDVEAWGGYVGKNDGYEPYGWIVSDSKTAYYFDIHGNFVKVKAL